MTRFVMERTSTVIAARNPESGSFLAVFDVDETLINTKSMFAFLRYFLVKQKGDRAGLWDYRRRREALEELRKSVSRAEVNREFYRSFRQSDVSYLRRLAEDWFASEMVENPHLFIPESGRLLKEYRRQGATIVFLSGSADFILEPVARHLGGGTLLAIRLEERNGLATGEIAGIQTIGAGKGQALVAFVQERGLSLNGSVALGDHVSDLSFLEMVDHPIVVAGDPELEQIARQKGWSLLDVAHPSHTP